MAADLVYVACPYSHPDKAVVEERMKAFYRVDSDLIKQGFFTVSPMNKAAMADHVDIATTWEFWEQYSYALLSRCTKMFVITMPGWDTSAGVLGEINFAVQNGIAVEYVY